MKAIQKSLANQIIAHLSQINRKLLLFFTPLFENLTFKLNACAEQCWFEKDDNLKVLKRSHNLLNNVKTSHCQHRLII